VRGKSIRLYIMGERFKNLKSAELSNWIGKTYIGERKHIENLKQIEDTCVPGIYFLLSEIENSYQKKVYIGEADSVRERLEQQYRQKDWWDNFVVFISKDTNLTKAHVRYLEKELYLIAKDNPTVLDLDNHSTPTGSRLSNADIDDMEAFKDNIIFVLKNLGILDFVKYRNNQSDISCTEFNGNADNIFYINVSTREDKLKNYMAKLSIVDDAYRLIKGSYIRKSNDTQTYSHNYVNLRNKLKKDEYFEDCGNYYKLLKDIDFKSPSAAAAIARNTSLNGRKEWKLKDGKTLDDYENS